MSNFQEKLDTYYPIFTAKDALEYFSKYAKAVPGKLGTEIKTIADKYLKHLKATKNKKGAKDNE